MKLKGESGTINICIHHQSTKLSNIKIHNTSIMQYSCNLCHFTAKCIMVGFSFSIDMDPLD